MAFCNKIGSLLKHNISHSGQAPMTAMLNSVRCMSSKLFIGGLSFGTNDESLKDAFSSFGDVTEARVIMDRNTGKSRGFGFIDFASDDSASSALSSMDGQELHGRNIRVSYATKLTGPRPFNGSGGGGDYRGNSGGCNGPSGY